MNALLRSVPITWKNLSRRTLRTVLTVAGIAVATFLFSFVESMRDGVRRATEAGAAETRLVVYRKNRFCPFTSKLPQSYERTIRDVPGVKSAVPVKIVVNNCRASLDVVTFRGVPDEGFMEDHLQGASLRSGSLADWKSRSDAVIVGSALADRRRLRAEVEKWQGVAATMSSEREHNANEAGRLRAERADELGGARVVGGRRRRTIAGPAHGDGQGRAQFDAPLVEGVDAPHDALHEGRVLIERDERAEGGWRECVRPEERARSVAGEGAVGHERLGGAFGPDLVAGPAERERLRLRDRIGVEQQAMTAEWVRRRAERDEVDRHDRRALVEHLVEGMLPVGARLAEDDRAGRPRHGLAVIVHALAV